MADIESFHGRIENESDCLVLIDLARRGLIPRIQRRLTSRERKKIGHGSIFVYCEEESRIKRWTDDMSWTPSRVQGVFLVYKQLLSSSPMMKRTYSATCGDRSFHIVGYLQIHSHHTLLPSVSILYKGIDFPTDIKIKKKLSFLEERCLKNSPKTMESQETHEDFPFDIYWY
ncbi:gluconate transport-inducing protein [Encephalitozoon intestinalis ATCC 50506]|uniref:Gluconate transport-inducing protein n=1 Tax=Encephalitozoon intestinalis (strain ATCC 50506) TaxID=876142 RepID=E0S5W2_ENCIT|nr:gluconate transport-inducing protein [Encephalitozoon intestinalis ATCC 50506]ADM11097.1 gluconate transport-inducing protein [Encephalitozoon intestinalis ATCC 50506]UTX44751.1 gluconate transport-inducing protein [Encephalitozoon intestinalis]